MRETVLDYFLEELISDLLYNQELYKEETILDVVMAIRDFYDNSGYENLADIEDMSDAELRDWMRGYVLPQ